MKYLLLYSLLFTFIACQSKPNKTPVATTQDTTAVVAKDTLFDDDDEIPELEMPAEFDYFVERTKRAKYHINADSIYICYANEKVIKYTRKQFNDIIDHFVDDYPKYEPDTTKAKLASVILIDKKNQADTVSFKTKKIPEEHLIYAYCLKYRTHLVVYSERKYKLFVLSQVLHNIYSTLYNGETYYGHKYNKTKDLEALYNYWDYNSLYAFKREHSISKQKRHYIAGLKQLVLDEEALNANPNQAERVNYLIQEIDKLDTLITENFYLQMAKSFSADHYKYSI